MALQAAVAQPSSALRAAQPTPTQTTFRKVGSTPQRRMVVLAQGETKTGHTHFALSAPGPIYYHAIDIGSEVIEGKPNAPWADKEVYLATYDVHYSPDWDFNRKSQEAEKHWKQFVANTELAAQKARSEVIDYESDLWELYRMFKEGVLNPEKLAYTSLSPEYRSALRHFYSGNQNLILLAKLKDEWKQNKSTGKRKRAGWSEADYLATIIIETWKRESTYGLTVLQCRMNPDIEGFELENPTFADLAMLVFPDSQLEDWK